jgi:hypothetical protein
MAKTYIVVKGDTLAKIAKAQLGDAKLAAMLADFNGLADANQIMIGQIIQLPSSTDLKTSSAPQPKAAAWPAPPNGFQGVRDTYGDILAFINADGNIDPKWEASRIVRQELPFAIPLAWDTSKSVTGIRCHKLLAPLFAEVFQQIVAQGLQKTVKTYGGCYQFRPKRNGFKPSTHSWGIAIDLNPNTNAMGTAGDMDPQLVALFEGLGFVWGGRWAGKGKDPMHFQFCTGY